MDAWNDQARSQPEESMRTTRKTATLGLVLALAVFVVAGTLAAQTSKREVFCEGLSAGQLCLSGTPSELKLDGTKKERWVEAGRQYNKSVDAATKQLLAQAKTILSPEEYARVEKWFDKGLNVVLNQVLIGEPATQK
jgi:hypothetical protein